MAPHGSHAVVPPWFGTRASSVVLRCHRHQRSSRCRARRRHPYGSQCAPWSAPVEPPPVARAVYRRDSSVVLNDGHGRVPRGVYLRGTRRVSRIPPLCKRNALLSGAARCLYGVVYYARARIVCGDGPQCLSLAVYCTRAKIVCGHRLHCLRACAALRVEIGSCSQQPLH
jgi:hypothetical protein